MPKLYEYLGLILFLYSNDHEPIHVHARKGGYESKAEIIIINGEISEVIISNVRGKNPLKDKDLKNLKVFLEHYSKDIVQKWVNYFVYHKEVDFEKITKKL